MNIKGLFSLLLLLLSLCSLPLNAQQPGWNRAAQTAGNADDNFYFSTTTDTENNLIAVGSSSKKIFLDDTMLYPSNIGSGYTYLWKQDANSNTVFVKTFEDVHLSTDDIKTDWYNNIYVTAHLYGGGVFEGITIPYQSFLVIKFDPLGNFIWLKQCPSGDLTVYRDGTCYLSGSFTNSISFGDITLTCAGEEDIFIARLSSDGEWQWAKRFGTANGVEICYQLLPQTNGDIFMAGTAPGTCSFDGLTVFFANPGLFIAKLNSTGTCVWLKGLGSSDYTITEYFHSIAANSPYEVYVFYGIVADNNPSYSGLYVKKYYTYQWFDTTILYVDSTSDVRGQAMEMDNAGNLYLTGCYFDPFTLGSFSYEWEMGSFLCKLNPTGEVLWAYDHGENTSYSFPYYHSLDVSPQGSVYLKTNCWGKKQLQPFFTYAGEGSYALKLSTNGVPEWLCSNWVRTIGTEATDVFRCPEGTAFVCGNFEADSFWGNNYLRNRGSTGKDIYIGKFNATNEIQWLKCAGGEGEQEVKAVYADADLNSYITGTFSDSIQFGDITLQSQGMSDVFVAKLDPLGNYLWAFAAGGNQDDAGLDLCVDQQGNIYVSGYYSGDATFGVFSANSVGGRDAFVLKLNSAGEFVALYPSLALGDDYAKAIVLDNLSRLWMAGNVSDDSETPTVQKIVLQKLSDNLDVMETISSTPAEELTVTGLALDGANNCYLSGAFKGAFNIGNIAQAAETNVSAFVARISSELACTWISSATADGAVCANAIATDSSGNSFIAGTMRGSGNFGGQTIQSWGLQDLFVAKLNNLGQWSWAKSNGSTNDDCANSIALNPGGLCSVVGRIDGRIGLGNNWLEPMDSYESFFGDLNYSTANPDEPGISPVQSTLQAYPNPFLGKLQLSLETKQNGQVSVKIYNLKGQLVRTLLDESKLSGTYALEWDGLSDSKTSCAAGVYLLKVSGSGTQQVKRVVKL
jgi:hypothetical protein